MTYDDVLATTLTYTTTTATVTTRLRSIFRVSSFGCGHLLSFRGLYSLRLKIALKPPPAPQNYFCFYSVSTIELILQSNFLIY